MWTSAGGGPPTGVSGRGLGRNTRGCPGPAAPPAIATTAQTAHGTGTAWVGSPPRLSAHPIPVRKPGVGPMPRPGPGERVQGQDQQRGERAPAAFPGHAGRGAGGDLPGAQVTTRLVKGDCAPCLPPSRRRTQHPFSPPQRCPPSFPPSTPFPTRACACTRTPPHTHACRAMGPRGGAARRPVYQVSDAQAALAGVFLSTVQTYLRNLVSDLRAYTLTDISATSERTRHVQAAVCFGRGEGGSVHDVCVRVCGGYGGTWLQGREGGPPRDCRGGVHGTRTGTGRRFTAASVTDRLMASPFSSRQQFHSRFSPPQHLVARFVRGLGARPGSALHGRICRDPALLGIHRRPAVHAPALRPLFPGLLAAPVCVSGLLSTCRLPGHARSLLPGPLADGLVVSVPGAARELDKTPTAPARQPAVLCRNPPGAL